MSDLISILEKSQLLSAFPMEYKEQLAGPRSAGVEATWGMWYHRTGWR
jgi:hypothetical protein